MNGKPPGGTSRRETRPVRNGGVTAGRNTVFHGGALSALGHRDYALFWTGAMMSNIGTFVQSTALLWYVKETTNSNAWVGAVNLANFVPILLFVLFAGYASDAYDRRRIILLTFAVMMACSLVLGIAQSAGADSLVFILAMVFVSGTAYTFSAPAGVSFLPYLVPEEDMMNALALSAAQFNIGRVAGPALGAIIVGAWSVAGAFYINAMSYVFIIAAIAVVRPRRAEVKMPRGDVLRHIGEGFGQVLGNRWMLSVLLSLGAVTFFGFSLTVLYPAVASDILGMKEGAYGLLLSFTGLGAALGAPLVTRLSGRLAEKEIIKGSALGLGLFLAAFSFSRTFWVSCLLSVGIGCSYLVIGACVNTLMQARSSPEMRGRMVSLYSMMWLGMFSVGGQFAGYLGDILTVQKAILYGGVACITVGALLTMLPNLTEGADSSLGIVGEASH